jgi:hypothetical protein
MITPNPFLASLPGMFVTLNSLMKIEPAGETTQSLGKLNLSADLARQSYDNEAAIGSYRLWI